MTAEHKRTFKRTCYFCAFLVALLLIALLIFPNSAKAHDCPPNVSKCKILTLTPEEEQALVAPSGVFDTAERARTLDLYNIIRYFRDRIATAPAGTPLKPVDTPPQ